MDQDEQLLERGYAAFNGGDVATAGAIADDLIRRHDRDVRVVALVGMAAYRCGHAARALPYLRAALVALPGNEELRAALVFTLFNGGALDEARAIAAVAPSPRFQRVVALIDHRQGRHGDAVRIYRNVVAALPADQESWHNLGLALAAAGDNDEAIAAFARALALHPGFVDAYVGQAQALARAERHPERRALLRKAVAQVPKAAELWVQLALAEGAVDAFADAEAAYRRALALDPSSPSTTLEYGMLLDRLNRLDDLRRLVADARSRGIVGGEIDFLESWSWKRSGRFAEALVLAERARGYVDDGRLAQLVAECADRLGDTDRAFAAFVEMNRHAALGPAADYARALDFPRTIATDTGRLSAGMVAAWPKIAVSRDDGAAPIFVVGFPRSGTTLLDTFLSAVPNLAVLEEVPVIERLEARIGSLERLLSLDPSDLLQRRKEYFEIAREMTGIEARDQRLVDKFPLNLVRIPAIHALFPDARIILVERHPADVVLSCFMARFQTNRATVHFHTLADAARLYCVAMESWTQTETLLPLAVHRVRYERLIDDTEAELRGVLQFADIPWDSAYLDHQQAAVRRPHVPTASYDQVGQPIYARAAGRWRRYQSHMQDILPRLARWIKYLGYD